MVPRSAADVTPTSHLLQAAPDVGVDTVLDPAAGRRSVRSPPHLAGAVGLRPLHLGSQSL